MTNIGGDVSAGLSHASGRHYVYQRVNTSKGKALHLADHLIIAARAFEHIYGYRPDIDEREVAARIAECIQAHRPSSRTGSIVMLCFVPTEDGGCELGTEYERPLLEAGYSHSALRPKAITYEYSIPFGAFPTNFQTEARALFDTLALRAHGATRSVRREGDKLLSCGDAPLFAIRDRTLIMPPLAEGAMDSVERNLVIAAAPRARLTVREESLLHPELKNFDELFFADAAGVTSLAECDGAKFMSLAAARIAAALV